MHLPPVQPASFTKIYVSGDVIIHDSAVVAPGTILQAAPNSRIVIGAGACIGMGVVLNAYQGAIEIETGAVLGSGVLILGTGKIGKNACVGSLTTILNASIAPMAVITAGSLIGDTSRQVKNEPETVNGNGATQARFSKVNPENKIQQDSHPQPTSPPKQQQSVEELESDPWNIDHIDNDQSSSKSDSVLSNTQVNEPEPAKETQVEVTPQPPNMDYSTEQLKQAPVVGQIYINQLLLTLFPERRHFQNLDQKNQSNNIEGNSQ